MGKSTRAFGARALIMGMADTNPSPSPTPNALIAKPIEKLLNVPLTVASSTCVILVLAWIASFYFFYQQNSILQKENADLSATNAALQQQISNANTTLPQPTSVTTSTSLATDNVNVAGAAPMSIVAEPSSGFSPLLVKLIIRVPSSKYGIIFGDGTLSYVSGGGSADTEGDCVPDESGLCAFVVYHTYTLKNGSGSTNFTVKVADSTKPPGTPYAASTIINVVNN